MSAVLIATFGGLITALCWGTGDWLTAKSSRRFDKYAINFVVQLIGAAIMSVVLLLSDVAFPDAQQVLKILCIAVLITSAYIIFIKALSSGAVGIVVPLANSYPVVTLTLAVIFLGSIFTSQEFIAMLAIVGGAALLAYEKNHKNISFKELHKETFLALCAAGMWGIAFFLIDSLVEQLSWQMLNGLVSIFMATIAGVLLLATSRSKVVQIAREPFTSLITLVAGVLFSVGSIAFYIGSERAGSAIIPTVISAGGPLVASILGAVVDGERIGVLKRLGAVSIVAGIVALNLL